jgi:hypothetical protein
VAPPRAPTSSQLLAPRPLGCVVAVAMVDLTLVKGVAERAQSHRVIVALNVQLAAARMRASLRPAVPVPVAAARGTARAAAPSRARGCCRCPSAVLMRPVRARRTTGRWRGTEWRSRDA